MSNITEKVAYIRGLADGMNIQSETNESKLLLAIIDVLDSFATEISALDETQDELSEYVESIDNDLGDLEDLLFGEDEDDHDEEDDDDDDLIEFECPHCGVSVYFDAYVFDLEEEHICPHCGKSISLDDLGNDD